MSTLPPGKRVLTPEGVRVRAKNPNGVGSVYQRNDGRWSATWRLPGDKWPRRASGSTREAAVARRAARMEAAGLEPPSDLIEWPCAGCEVVSAGPDDVLCASCRQWVTANTPRITDPVEIVLDYHQAVPLPDLRRPCQCGELFETPSAWRRHVAELIYQALDMAAGP